MRTAVVLLALSAAAPCVASQPRLSEVYGQVYAEVGDPGNAPYVYRPTPSANERSIGAVNRRYRIAVTEVTRTQWAEFANAITPFLNNNEYFNSDFAPALAITGFSNGRPVFAPADGHANYPARMGWRWAARYCNWLHNGKALTAEAFESGAYDTSTFGTEIGEFGFTEYTDQSTRSTGAKFWIPSEDEWVKAAFYDPNKNGEGQGGYWQYAGMSDDPLVTAPPGMGGETNAGGQKYEGPGEVPFDVGSYPNAASHYGVLDISGGETEWTETWSSPLFERGRIVRGSSYFTSPDFFPFIEGINPFTDAPPDGGSLGLRLATIVPSPGGAVFAGLGLLLAKRKRL